MTWNPSNRFFAISYHQLLPLTFYDQVIYLLMPFHLRVLLDLASQKILRDLAYESWEDLRADRNIHELAGFINRNLSHASHSPSQETIYFLCSYNHVQRSGYSAAHVARPEDV